MSEVVTTALIIQRCVGGCVGLFIGVLLLWLVLLPLLYYRHFGFYLIAFIREKPPKGYRYNLYGDYPLWIKDDATE
jgi:hypothetical protein